MKVTPPRSFVPAIGTVERLLFNNEGVFRIGDEELQGVQWGAVEQRLHGTDWCSYRFSAREQRYESVVLAGRVIGRGWVPPVVIYTFLDRNEQVIATLEIWIGNARVAILQEYEEAMF